MAWIHYKYELTCEDPISQIWFNFGFDTSDAEDSRQMLITFFGNMQIDNLYNNQIGDLESTIIGNPNQTEPPVIGEIDGLETQVGDIMDGIINNWAEGYVSEHYNNSIDQIAGGMFIASIISERVLDNSTILLLVSVCLTISSASF